MKSGQTRYLSRGKYLGECADIVRKRGHPKEKTPGLVGGEVWRNDGVGMRVTAARNCDGKPEVYWDED